jgi:hypothetical protein
MITKEAIEAAKKATPQFWRDTDNFERNVSKIITAAFAAMPGPAVKVPTGKAYWDIMDAAIAAYEANTPTSHRYSAIALTKAVDAAIFALTPAPDLASENERLRAALVNSIVTAACELDGPADPDHPDTICISMDDLEAIVERHVTAALERT